MNRRLICLIVLSFTLLSVSSCQANPVKKKETKKTMTPDSIVYSNLGKTVSDVLFNPTKVFCWRLKGVTKADSLAVEIEPHWVRDSFLCQLSPEMIGVLQFALISNNSNYANDSVLVRSPYVPAIEFEFVQKKTVVHLLISTSDFTWTVMFDDKKQFNYNYQDKDLIARFCDYFLQ